MPIQAYLKLVNNVGATCHAKSRSGFTKDKILEGGRFGGWVGTSEDIAITYITGGEIELTVSLAIRFFSDFFSD
jgi:hypothetical protein